MTWRIRETVLAVPLALGQLFSSAVHAEPSRTEYASLARDKVFLRQGPTYRHRVLWIYRRKGLPVRVLSQYEIWRRVEMPDGTKGWVNAAMLSPRRMAVVISRKRAVLRENSGPAARIVALAEAGVVAKLKSCGPAACEVEAEGIDGWIDKKDLWGVSARETF